MDLRIFYLIILCYMNFGSLTAWSKDADWGRDINSVIVQTIPGKDMSIVVQSAIDEASANGQNIILGPGTFLINSTINIPSNVTLRGVSAGDGIGVSFERSTVLKGSASPMMQLCDRKTPKAGFSSKVEDLWLFGRDMPGQIGLFTGCNNTVGFRHFTLNRVNIRNFTKNLVISDNSYHFSVSNFVMRVKKSKHFAFEASSHGIEIISDTLEPIIPGETYIFSDRFSVIEAVIEGVNHDLNIIKTSPPVMLSKGVFFRKRTNILVQNRRGPTGSQFSTGLIYNGVGVEWQAGGAPGVSFSNIDFDQSDLEVYFNNVGKKKSLIAPALFVNIGSENNEFLSVFSNFSKSVIGIDSYVANTRQDGIHFVSLNPTTQIKVNTLANRYCSTDVFLRNVEVGHRYCSRD